MVKSMMADGLTKKKFLSLYKQIKDAEATFVRKKITKQKTFNKRHEHLVELQKVREDLD